MSSLQPGDQFKDIVILPFSEIRGTCPVGDMNGMGHFRMLGQDHPCSRTAF